MKEFILELSGAEIEKILNMLAEQPYKKCAQIIDNIQLQIKKQMQSENQKQIKK